jgi:O-antigen/teichoic acid export membrane protein
MTTTSIASKNSQGAASAPVPPDRPLASSVFLMFGTRVLVQVFSIAGTVVLARTLGPDGRGSIAVALSFALLLVQFGSFGLESANLYFAARDLQRIGTIVLNSLWATAAIGIVLAAVAFLAKALFPASLNGLDWLDVLVVAAGLPALLASRLLQSVFLAEGRVRIYNGVELAGSVVVCVGLVVGLIFLHIGVTGAIAVMLGTNWAMALVFLVLQRAKVPRLGWPDMELLWRMFKYGVRVHATVLLAYLVSRISLFLVNSHLGPAQAGFYAIAIGIGENLHLLPSIVPLNLFPRIARGDSYESSAAVFRTLCVVFGGLCLLSIPLAKPGLELLYGPRFAAAAVIYYWMLPGIFCYGMINVLAYHFAARGLPIGAILVWIPGLIVSVVVTAVFLPRQGAPVAGLALSIAFIIVLVLHMRMFAQESGGYRMLIPRSRELMMLPRILVHGLRTSLHRN